MISFFMEMRKRLNTKIASGIGMEMTAIIRKGEGQYVALCPEVDVVSQGHTIEQAIENLKEAVELHIEEVGLPEASGEPIITRFSVGDH
jgi:predicted RNase H-like HicB family nuclease